VTKRQKGGAKGIPRRICVNLPKDSNSKAIINVDGKETK